MQYYIILNSFLLILFTLRFHAYSNRTFSKDTTIAHVETSLFLDYVGQYVPAETIIHNSAMFPMTSATCHFLPLSAAENIPSCNITRTRHKRMIDAVIGVAIGAASLGVSIANSVQIANLHQQVAVVQDSLSRLSSTVDIHGAQLVKLSSKHIEVTAELEVTQKAISDMIPVLDQHATFMNSLHTNFQKLRLQMQHSFLYLALTQICNNELTLGFLLPEDIHKVVYNVIESGNLTFDSYSGSLPIVQIITKLLVRQQIDFVPRSEYISDDLEEIIDPEEIGRLVITSFFAIPPNEHKPFHTYKIVTIPFFHENETIQLAHLPQYWAINPENNNTIEWHKPEESGCDLQLMTSCRDTPPIRTVSKDTCLDQIIQRLPLSNCQITSIPDEKYFIRQLRDNFWVTSSREPVHCIKTAKTQYYNVIQPTWSLSEEVILPPVSLVNVTDGYTISCPGFTLTGRPVAPKASSLIIMYKSDVLTKNISVMNVHDYIIENMTWFKQKVAERERNTLMGFINQIKAIPAHQTQQTSFYTYMRLFGVFTSNWVLFGLAAALLYYVYRRKRRNTLSNF